MTEWWLRKAVICHLSPISCNYHFVQDGITMSPLTRSRGERDGNRRSKNRSLRRFQLTRSVGSVTGPALHCRTTLQISTHTLRGERDQGFTTDTADGQNFNSHAPWGA